MLEKLERVTTDKLVAEELKNWIIDKELKPGERMPTEQQLCEELGVARHTLREGVKRLSQLGIVESRAGYGMFVNPVSFDNMAEYMLFLMQRGEITYQDINSVRTVLEVHAAELASQNADTTHIASLRSAMSEMRKAYYDGKWERYIQTDIDFHLALANATENQLLIGMLNAIRQLITTFMTALDKKTVDGSFADHCQILEAVEKHDAENAKEVMRRHLIGLTSKLYVPEH